MIKSETKVANNGSAVESKTKCKNAMIIFYYLQDNFRVLNECPSYVGSSAHFHARLASGRGANSKIFGGQSSILGQTSIILCTLVMVGTLSII